MADPVSGGRPQTAMQRLDSIPMRLHELNTAIVAKQAQLDAAELGSTDATQFKAELAGLREQHAEVDQEYVLVASVAGGGGARAAAALARWDAAHAKVQEASRDLQGVIQEPRGTGTIGVSRFREPPVIEPGVMGTVRISGTRYEACLVSRDARPEGRGWLRVARGSGQRDLFVKSEYHRIVSTAINNGQNPDFSANPAVVEIGPAHIEGEN